VVVDLDLAAEFSAGQRGLGAVDHRHDPVRYGEWLLLGGLGQGEMQGMGLQPYVEWLRCGSGAVLEGELEGATIVGEIGIGISPFVWS
jgi:hypothetical protein